MDDQISYGSDDRPARPRPLYGVLAVVLAVVAAGVLAADRRDRTRSKADAAASSSPSGSPTAEASATAPDAVTATRSPSVPTLPPSRPRPVLPKALTGVRSRVPTAQLLVLTGDGPALFDAASGRLAPVADAPPADPTADRLEWRFVRSGSAVFAMRQDSTQEATGHQLATIYLVRGRRLVRLGQGSDIVPAALPGHVLVPTYGDRLPTAIAELDSSGREVGDPVPLEPTAYLVGAAGRSLLVGVRSGDAMELQLRDRRGRIVRSLSGPAEGPAVTSAGTLALISCAVRGCELSVEQLDRGSRSRWPLPAGHFANGPKLSPDGRSVVLSLSQLDEGGTTVDQRLAVVDVATGHVTLVPGTHLGTDHALMYEWDAHTDTITISNAGSIAVWFVDADQLELLPEPDVDVTNALCLSGC